MMQKTWDNFWNNTGTAIELKVLFYFYLEITQYATSRRLAYCRFNLLGFKIVLMTFYSEG